MYRAIMYDNDMVLLEQEDNGVKTEKIVDLKAYVSCLSTNSAIATPLLPRNCLRYIKNGMSIKLMLDMDPVLYRQKLDLSGCPGDYSTSPSITGTFRDFADFVDPDDDDYDEDSDEDSDGGGNDYYEFPAFLPRCLMCIELRYDQSRGSYRFITESARLYYYVDPILSPTTSLYMFPFGNVYETMALCFGGMDVYGLCYNQNDLRGVSSIYGLWLNAESNNDLRFMAVDGKVVDFAVAMHDVFKGHSSIDELMKAGKYQALLDTYKSKISKDRVTTFDLVNSSF